MTNKSNCPFCGGEMKKGVIRGDGRTAPKWQAVGERKGLFDSGRPIRNFRCTFPVVEADGLLCERCGKLILDVRF